MGRLTRAETVSSDREVKIVTAFIVSTDFMQRILSRKMYKAEYLTLDTPLVELSADELRRFEDIGVSRLVPMTWGNPGPDELVAFVEKAGGLL